MIRKNKHFIVDLADSIKSYMDRYNCSFQDSVQDLDHPITYKDVEEVSKFMNITLTDLEIQQLGRSEKLVSDYLREEQADYDSIYE